MKTQFVKSFFMSYSMLRFIYSIKFKKEKGKGSQTNNINFHMKKLVQENKPKVKVVNIKKKPLLYNSINIKRGTLYANGKRDRKGT